MILKGGEIARYIARPDPSRPALLIYGQDAMRVALKRAEAVLALTGEHAEEEMRLTRMGGGQLRKDPAQLMDAIKSVGFFPGQRVVLVEDTPDGAADAIKQALGAWEPGDAVIVVTASGLAKSSALRKLFESHGVPSLRRSMTTLPERRRSAAGQRLRVCVTSRARRCAT